MRSFVLLVVIALFAVLLISVLLPDASAPRATAPAVREDAGSASTAPPANGEQPLPPIAPARETTPAAAPAAPPPPSLDDGGKPVPVGLDFTWKYGREERQKLGERLSKLEDEVQLAAEREFNARFERNAFETYTVEPNDARSIEEIVDASKHDGELCSTRLVAEASSAAAQAVRPSAVQVVCLARRDHAELYALADERDWLRAYVGRLDFKKL